MLQLQAISDVTKYFRVADTISVPSALVVTGTTIESDFQAIRTIIRAQSIHDADVITPGVTHDVFSQCRTPRAPV